jgi:AcrR family transcriptional regulator
MTKTKPRRSARAGNGPSDRSGVPRRSNAVLEKPAQPATKRGRATRQRLKDALSRQLQDHPFHQIRLEDITREAGVRVSLFYHYFSSKIDITHEVLSDLLDGFRSDVGARPKGDTALDAIHYANQRMIALYSTNPGAMRCLFEVHEESAPFASMWRDLTMEWNQRIATKLHRQFPDAFAAETDYLSLAYALAGTVDNFLIEYFVYRNPVLRQALRAEEDIARFLSTLWYRALYLDNPPDAFLGPLAGFKQVRLPATPAARRSAAKSKPRSPAGAARRPSRT